MAGNLPNGQQLEERKQKAQDKLRSLGLLYENFINEWERIEKEERELLVDFNKVVDTSKIAKIQNIIKNLN